MQLTDQIHLERTADTAVLQRYQRVVVLRHDPAFLNQGCINIDFTDIVDDHRKADTFRIRQDAVQKGCLAATKISGKQQDRDFIYCKRHIQDNIYLLIHVVRIARRSAAHSPR